MNTKIVPLFDYILVFPIQVKDHQDKTESGIIIPNAPTKNANQGTILAVGEQITQDFSVGDKVIFRNFSFEVVDTDDGKLLLIKEKDIMAKVKER